MHRTPLLNNGNLGRVRDELPLDAEMLHALSRRARRRLRDLETATQTTLQIDRARQVLCIQGSPQGIAEVKREVECRAGPRKVISNALWFELLRTRKTAGPASALYHVQHLCDCRLHIERGRPEVRIFGAEAAAGVAVALIDQLNVQCKSECLPVDAGAWLCLTDEKLDQLGQRLGVTLKMNAGQVVVHGLMDLVSPAKDEVARFLSQPDDYLVPDLMESADASAAQVMNGLQPPPQQPKAAVRRAVPQSPSHSSQSSFTEGAWEMMQVGYASASMSADGMAVQASYHPMAGSGAHVCLRCGAPRYCSHCGNPNWPVFEPQLDRSSSCSQPAAGSGQSYLQHVLQQQSAQEPLRRILL